MKLPLISMLAVAGALCCTTSAFAADAAATGKVLKTVAAETGSTKPKAVETPRKEAGKTEVPAKLPPQQEVPTKVVLAAD